MICHELFSCESNVAFMLKSQKNSFSGFVGRLNLLGSLLISHLTPLELFCFGLSPDFNIGFSEYPSYDNSRNSKMFSNRILACSALIHGADFIRWKIDLIINRHNLGAPSHHYSSSLEVLSKEIRGHLKVGGDSFNGDASVIHFDRVIDADSLVESFHVYNLSTVSGYYITQTAIVSNCRCLEQPQIDF